MTLTGSAIRPFRFAPALRAAPAALCAGVAALGGLKCARWLEKKETLPGRGEARWQGLRCSTRSGRSLVWSQQMGSADSEFNARRLAAGERMWLPRVKGFGGTGEPRIKCTVTVMTGSHELSYVKSLALYLIGGMIIGTIVGKVLIRFIESSANTNPPTHIKPPS